MIEKNNNNFIGFLPSVFLIARPADNYYEVSKGYTGSEKRITRSEALEMLWKNPHMVIDFSDDGILIEVGVKESCFLEKYGILP